MEWSGSGGVASGRVILAVHPSPREGDVREGHLGTGSAEGLQPQERDWNRRDWNLNCKLVKCTGALHSSFLPNQADSCSVELTEGWCRAAILGERGGPASPKGPSIHSSWVEGGQVLILVWSCDEEAGWAS